MTTQDDYPPQIPEDTIPALRDAGITPAEAASWLPHVRDGRTIAGLTSAGFTRQVLCAWPAHMSGQDVLELHTAGFNPRDAAGWPTHLTAANIIELRNAKIHAEAASAFPPHLTVEQMIRLVYRGVRPEQAGQIFPVPPSDNEFESVIFRLDNDV